MNCGKRFMRNIFNFHVINVLFSDLILKLLLKYSLYKFRTSEFTMMPFMYLFIYFWQRTIRKKLKLWPTLGGYWTSQLVLRGLQSPRDRPQAQTLSLGKALTGPTITTSPGTLDHLRRPMVEMSVQDHRNLSRWFQPSRRALG